MINAAKADARPDCPDVLAEAFEAMVGRPLILEAEILGAHDRLMAGAAQQLPGSIPVHVPVVLDSWLGGSANLFDLEPVDPTITLLTVTSSSFVE